MKQIDFLNYFPFSSIREGQNITLNEAQKTIHDWDVLVVRAPVGSGKSAIAVAMQLGFNAAGLGCSILTPNNILRAQYTEEFNHLSTVFSINDYVVPKHSLWHGRRKLPHKDLGVGDFKKMYGVWPRGNEYTKDLNHCKKKLTPTCLNYYSYLAHRMYKDVVIFDEGHNVLEMLKNVHAFKIWKHLVNFPSGLKTFGELLEWAEENQNFARVGDLLKELQRQHPASVIEYANDSYHGQLKECIKVRPLSVSDYSPILWPDKTKRIIIMSATISKHEISKLGLSDRVVKYVDTLSPIPIERRPLVPLSVADMSYRNQPESIPLIAQKIIDLASKHKGEKGLIHATYGIAQKLKAHLSENPRFIFHNHVNKKEIFNKFKESDDLILIGSGMSEGISLYQDLARWQCITKVPYPSLVDSSNRWILKNEPEYYRWLTARELLQSYGRVSRGEDDYGITYVLDSSWERWYTQTKADLPAWFKEGVVTDEKLLDR